MSPLPILALIAMTSSPTPSLKHRIDRFMRKAQKELHIPGLAYAVVRGDATITEGAVGKASLTYGVPVTLKTPFLLASVTKQFTAAAIMKLVEDGKVRLDEPISTYLPETPTAWKEITVRRLLTHTAGLKDRFEEKDTSKWRLNYSTTTMLDAAKGTPLDFAPGERWQYSDQGYFLLGRIVEEVSGQTYRAFLRDTFFHPLGMNASTTIRQDEIIPGLAEGYSRVGEKWVHNHRRTEYGLVSHFGVVSTVGDLVKWAAALRDGKVLKPDSVQQMWQPARLADGSVTGIGTFPYGFGWFLDEFNGHRIVQHGGSTGTSLYTLPEDKVTIVVLTNLEQLSGGDATGLARIVAKMAVPGASWAAVQASPGAERSAAPLAQEIRRILSGVAPTEELYEPSYFRLYKPALAAQLTSIARLGKPTSARALFDHRSPDGRTVGVALEYPKLKLFAVVRLNASGKIVNVFVEDEDLPD